MPTLRLGSTAPDFEAETTKGRIKFHEWIGDSWVVWIFYPPSIHIQCIYARPSSSRTQMTSLRYALLNSPKSLAVPPISRSVMSSSLACLRTVSNRTISGSLTSMNGARPTSSIRLYVPCSFWIHCGASLTLIQIADADRKIATLYDMLDHQDASNVDKKGLPLTVRPPHSC